MQYIFIAILCIVFFSLFYIFFVNIIIKIKITLNKFGKKIYKFGRMDNGYLNYVIWLNILYMLNRIKYTLENHKYIIQQYSKDEIIEIYILLIILFIVCIILNIVKYKKVKIFESGIVSLIGTWHWNKINGYKWIYSKQDKIIGIQFRVRKNIILTWRGIIKIKIYTKEEPYVKLLIEKYMYDNAIKYED